ncbi:hypothetical protein [Limnobacter sp.]|uniref:hypothetical protein n=1 Tax=Limnobacter sp. TaxID=2003368 RepID=UPI002FE1C7E0
MLNVIIPMAGISKIADDLEYPYPSPLIEINGRPLIQLVIENIKSLASNINFIVILREDDCRRFHLDSTIQLLTSKDIKIVRLKQETAGALCSTLLAVDYFSTDEPLLITNSDQLFENNSLSKIMTEINRISPDAACPIIESVHPRWSYARIIDNNIIETAEKNPISCNAIPGFYYFKSGFQFANLAMRTIINGRHTEGRYYTSAVLNEYILENLNVCAIPICNDDYVSFFTAQRVLDYERRSTKDNKYGLV